MIPSLPHPIHDGAAFWMMILWFQHCNVLRDMAVWNNKTILLKLRNRRMHSTQEHTSKPQNSRCKPCEFQYSKVSHTEK